MVKEMYPAPAAACAGVDPVRLLPTCGAAVMVRDREAAQDGWFWGWFGWGGWDPDWPPGADESLSLHGLRPVLRQLPCLGAGQPDLRQPAEHPGEPGEPLVFL